MTAPYNQVVLFGDSLFQGSVDLQNGFSFQAVLQAYCIRRLDVVNRGFSGWSTQNAIQYLEKIFPPRSSEQSSGKIDYLLVLLGANDAVIPMPTTSQGVTVEEYKKNLKAIITHPNIVAHDPKILLVTPPPLDEIRITELDLAWGHSGPTRTAEKSAAYSQVARDVAAEVPGTVLVDLQKALMEKAISITPDYDPNGPKLGYPGGKQGGLKELLPDGLHMSSEAYKVFSEIVKPHIGPFPADSRGYVFPDWRELNPGSI